MQAGAGMKNYTKKKLKHFAEMKFIMLFTKDEEALEELFHSKDFILARLMLTGCF